jgi:hypothetical protein
MYCGSIYFAPSFFVEGTKFYPIQYSLKILIKSRWVHTCSGDIDKTLKRAAQCCNPTLLCLSAINATIILIYSKLKVADIIPSKE